jgi:hypothetical protein
MLEINMGIIELITTPVLKTLEQACFKALDGDQRFSFGLTSE